MFLIAICLIASTSPAFLALWIRERNERKLLEDKLRIEEQYGDCCYKRLPVSKQIEADKEFLFGNN